MAFIPAPDCVEVTLRFIWAGQIVAITLSFCRADDVTAENIEDLLTILADWWEVTMATDISNEITLVALQGRDLTSADSFVVEIARSIAGEIVADSVPNNSTVVITFETGLAGRSFRGRNYIPGVSEGSLTSSVQLNPTVVADFLANYAIIPDVVGASGWNHCVISRYHNNAPRVTAVSTVITGYSSDGFLDSQRRRLAGRGE